MRSRTEIGISKTIKWHRIEVTSADGHHSKILHHELVVGGHPSGVVLLLAAEIRKDQWGSHAKPPGGRKFG
jgi:hypothetical protein